MAHLRTVILSLFLSGCGFSGALYLPDPPEEPPPAAGEPSAPEAAGAQSEDSPA